jgi:hypothetical protein
MWKQLIHAVGAVSKSRVKWETTAHLEKAFMGIFRAWSDKPLWSVILGSILVLESLVATISRISQNIKN